MVVVYSGDSDRPAPRWEAEPTPRGPAVQGAGPYETGPFLPVRDFYRHKLSSGPGLFDALLKHEEPPDLEPALVSTELPLASLEPALALPGPAYPPPSEFQLTHSPPQVGEGVAQRPANVADENPACDARTRPTVRGLRSPASARPASIAPGPQRAPSTAPGAFAAPALVSAAKLLAARRQLASGRPPEPAKPAGVPRGLLLGLLGVAACLGFFLVQRARSRGAPVQTSAPLVAVIEPSRTARAAAALGSTLRRPPPVAERPPRSSPARVAPVASDEPSAAASGIAPPASPAVPSAAAASAPVKSTRTVTLEVVPPDANVFALGGLRKGPPFTFELRPGARVVVEVVRDGYVARRVVLDGSKPELAVGLMRKKKSAVPVPPRGESPAGSGASVAPDGRGAVVRSGL